MKTRRVIDTHDMIDGTGDVRIGDVAYWMEPVFEKSDADSGFMAWRRARQVGEREILARILSTSKGSSPRRRITFEVLESIGIQALAQGETSFRRWETLVRLGTLRKRRLDDLQGNSAMTATIQKERELQSSVPTTQGKWFRTFDDEDQGRGISRPRFLHVPQGGEKEIIFLDSVGFTARIHKITLPSGNEWYTCLGPMGVLCPLCSVRHSPDYRTFLSVIEPAYPHVVRLLIAPYELSELLRRERKNKGGRLEGCRYLIRYMIDHYNQPHRWVRFLGRVDLSEYGYPEAVNYTQTFAPRTADELRRIAVEAELVREQRGSIETQPNGAMAVAMRKWKSLQGENP